jgi:hypothetical protein
MDVLLHLVNNKAAGELQDIRSSLQELLRRLISIDGGNLDIAALLIYRYQFNIDRAIMEDVLEQVTSSDLWRKRYTTLQHHPMLLKCLDFFI